MACNNGLVVRAVAAGPLLFAAGVVLATGACGRKPVHPVPKSASGTPAAVLPGADGELPRPLTTDGAIAVHNLEAQTAHAQAFVQSHPGDDSVRATLVQDLLTSAQFFGILANYDRAVVLAEQGIRNAPEDGGAHLLRAKVRARLHLFREALLDLDAAATKPGMSAKAIEAIRASILHGTGKTEQALAAFRALRTTDPSLTTFGAEATALGELGDTVAARAAFASGRSMYGDVNPFPLAWLEFQEGLMEERSGNAAQARVLYQHAQTRLPGYAEAAAHLAALEAAGGQREGRERAIARMEPIVAHSDDPEYLGQLAALYRDAGRTGDAARLLARAKAGYEDLLRRHPAAFTDHAAHFWLGPGGDPGRALALAQSNIDRQRTPRAQMLLLEARLALHAR